MRALLAFACLALSGCPPSGPRPEEPVWGKQQCAHCAMLVSERPPAAQALEATGKRRYFDDVGCLIAWEDREPRQLSARWVRGPGGEGWVDPAATRFSSGHATPMDFGFLASEQGVGLDEVRAAVREKTARRAGGAP